jgi:hypothetical protein
MYRLDAQKNAMFADKQKTPNNASLKPSRPSPKGQVRERKLRVVYTTAKADLIHGSMNP